MSFAFTGDTHVITFGACAGVIDALTAHTIGVDVTITTAPGGTADILGRPGTNQLFVDAAGALNFIAVANGAFTWFKTADSTISSATRYKILVSWKSSTGAGQALGRIEIDGVNKSLSYPFDQDESGASYDDNSNDFGYGSGSQAIRMTLHCVAQWNSWSDDWAAGDRSDFGDGSVHMGRIRQSDAIWYDPCLRNPPHNLLGTDVGTVTGASFTASSDGLHADLDIALELAQPSGSRRDAVGTMDLTDVNTVGSGAGLLYVTAADFVAANSERLTHADDAAFDIGDNPWTLEFWTNPDLLTVYRVFVAKGTGAEWRSYYDQVGNRYVFEAAPAGGGGAVIVSANNFGAPSTGGLVQIVCQHDPDANQISIRVNNGTPDTASLSGGVAASTGAFAIGSDGDGSQHYVDGKMNAVRVYSALLDNDQISFLYNAGDGRVVGELGDYVAPPVTGSPWYAYAQQ